MIMLIWIRMCAACLQANSSYYYSCDTCFEAETASSTCGWSTNQIINCPRAHYCSNIEVRSNAVHSSIPRFYQMDSGDTCLIKIENGMQNGQKVIMKVGSVDNHSGKKFY